MVLSMHPCNQMSQQAKHVCFVLEWKFPDGKWRETPDEDQHALQVFDVIFYVLDFHFFNLWVCIILRCGFKYFLCSSRSLGTWSNLTSIFLKMVWFNHQLVITFQSSLLFLGLDHLLNVASQALTICCMICTSMLVQKYPCLWWNIRVI